MKFSEFVKSKKEIKIGYLGGSITEGNNAYNDVEACYRVLVSKELNEKYTGTEFIGIAAAIGGTGSNLGLFRMDHDMMQYEPDIVFIEFAVNDYRLSNTDMYMENIVRKILKKNPDAKIVFIYTLSEVMINEAYSKNMLPVSVAKQMAVAKYYNIPDINVGKELYDKLTAEGLTMRSYAPDGVHPNNNAYRIYTDKIMSELENMEFNIVFPEQPMIRDICNARTVAACTIPHDGWTEEDTWLFRKSAKSAVCSDVPGAKLTFEFEGSILGLYYIRGKDSGNIEYTIDGEIKGTLSMWDHYCLQFNRSSSSILCNNLAHGKHTLEITVSDTKDPQSEGTFVKIGAFLIG